MFFKRKEKTKLTTVVQKHAVILTKAIAKISKKILKNGTQKNKQPFPKKNR